MAKVLQVLIAVADAVMRAPAGRGAKRDDNLIRRRGVGDGEVDRLVMGVCSGWGQNDTLRSDVIDFSTCIRR